MVMPSLLLQRADFAAHFLAQLRVEVGQRLVHQAHRRLGDDRAAERDALLLAAGELGRLALEQFLQAEQAGDARQAPGAVRRRAPCAPSGRTRCSRPPTGAGTARRTGTPSRCRAAPAAARSRRCRRCSTWPALTSSSPAIRRSVVDLPQPEGPSSTTKRPAAASKLTSSTARAASHALVTPRRLIADTEVPSPVQSYWKTAAAKHTMAVVLPCPETAMPTALRWIASGLLAAAATLGIAQDRDAGRDVVAETLSAIVRVKAKILPNARSSATLGAQREGSGVLVRDGYVATIGYLVIEAESIEVTGARRQVGAGRARRLRPCERLRPAQAARAARGQAAAARRFERARRARAGAGRELRRPRRRAAWCTWCRAGRSPAAGNTCSTRRSSPIRR